MANLSDLERRLLEGRQFQGGMTGIAESPSRGGLERVIASIRSRRQASRNEDLANTILAQREQQRNRVIEQLPEQSRGLARELPFGTLQDILTKRVESQIVPEERKTLKDVSGRQRFIDTGEPVFENVDVRANQFNVTPETLQIPDLKERAEAIEQTALANAQAGNLKLAREQRQQASILRREKGLIDKDVKDLAKGLDESGFTGLIDALEKSTAIINEGRDIPGAGASGALPDWLVTGKGKKLRQSVATVRNAILKARSGGAVTPSEASRLLEEIGIGKTKTDEQLRTGLKNAVDILKTKVGTIQSSVRPEAISVFRERGNDPFARLENLNVKSFGEEQIAQSQELDELQQIEEELKRRGGQ